MKDVREIVLYFGDGSKLVPIDIAKALCDRFKEIGNPLVLPPEEVKKGAPLIVYKDNPDFMITVTQLTVNLVVKYKHFEKIDTIIFDLVDVFEDLDISLIRMGMVYSIFLSPDTLDSIKNKLFNVDYLPEDLVDLRLSFYKKIESKIGTINCWERIITDCDKFKDVLFQFDFNTQFDSKSNFDMKFIKTFIKLSDEYSEERINY